MIWPRTYALFEEYTLHGVHLSASEVVVLRRVLEAPPERRLVELACAEAGFDDRRRDDLLARLGVVEAGS